MRTLSAPLAAEQIKQYRNPTFKATILSPIQEIPFNGKLFEDSGFDEGYPDILQLSSGEYVSVFCRKTSNNTNNRYNVYVRISDTSDTTWGSAIELTSATDGSTYDYINPSLVQVGSTIGIVFQRQIHSSGVSDIRAVVVNTAGTITVSEFTIGSVGSTLQQPSVCIASNGTYVLVCSKSAATDLSKFTSSNFTSWSGPTTFLSGTDILMSPKVSLSRATGGTFLNVLLLSYISVTTFSGNQVGNVNITISSDNGATFSTTTPYPLAITAYDIGTTSTDEPIGQIKNDATLYIPYIRRDSVLRYKLPKQASCFVHDSTNNRFMIGTEGFGVYIYSKSDGSYTNLTTSTSPAILNNNIYSIAYDSVGDTLYVGYGSGGFGKITLSPLTVTNYTWNVVGTTQNELLHNSFGSGSNGILTSMYWNATRSKLLYILDGPISGSGNTPSATDTYGFVEFNPSDNSFTGYGQGYAPWQFLSGRHFMRMDIWNEYIFFVGSDENMHFNGDTTMHVFWGANDSNFGSFWSYLNVDNSNGEMHAPTGRWNVNIARVLYDSTLNKIWWSLTSPGASNQITEFIDATLIEFDWDGTSGNNTAHFNGSVWGKTVGPIGLQDEYYEGSDYDPTTHTFYGGSGNGNPNVESAIESLSPISNLTRYWAIYAGGEQVIPSTTLSNHVNGTNQQLFYYDTTGPTSVIYYHGFISPDYYIFALNPSGAFSQVVYVTGTYSGSWTITDESIFVNQNVNSNVGGNLKYSTDKWLFSWTSKELSGKYRVRWDEELGDEFDLTSYIVNGCVINFYEEDQAGDCTIQVASPNGIFDPSNIYSINRTRLQEGNILKIYSGDVISGLPTTILVFYGYITFAQEVDYTRGTAEVYRIKAYDRSKWFTRSKITTGVYTSQLVEDIAANIAQFYMGLDVSEYSFPSTGVTLERVQIIQEPPMEALRLLFQSAGYMPYWRGDGTLTARKMNTTASVDYSYSDGSSTNKISMQWQDEQAVNQVSVTGQTVSLHDVVYDEEFLVEVFGTSGWWGQSKDITLYYNSDHSMKCQIASVRMDVEKGLGDSYIPAGTEYLADVQDYYCVVHQSVRNQVLGLLALASVGDFLGIGFIDGAVIGQMILILLEVGDFHYKIYGRPLGESIPYNVFAQSKDLTLQSYEGGVIEKVIDNPFIPNQTVAQQLADYELSKSKWFRKKPTSTVQRNLAFEPGDIVSVYNPRTSLPIKIYVSQVTHNIGDRTQAETTIITGGYIE